MLPKDLIDFMNRADFNELAVWMEDGEHRRLFVAVAETIGFDKNEQPVVVRAKAADRTGAIALLAAVARHKVMEGGNG